MHVGWGVQVLGIGLNRLEVGVTWGLQVPRRTELHGVYIQRLLLAVCYLVCLLAGC